MWEIGEQVEEAATPCGFSLAPVTQGALRRSQRPARQRELAPFAMAADISETLQRPVTHESYLRPAMADGTTRPVRLQPEPSFVLPNPHTALRAKHSKETLSALCRDFPRAEFEDRCYRESAVMPMLCLGARADAGVLDVEKMTPHLVHTRNVGKRKTDIMGAYLTREADKEFAGGAVKITDSSARPEAKQLAERRAMPTLTQEVQSLTASWNPKAIDDGIALDQPCQQPQVAEQAPAEPVPCRPQLAPVSARPMTKSPSVSAAMDANLDNLRTPSEGMEVLRPPGHTAPPRLGRRRLHGGRTWKFDQLHGWVADPVADKAQPVPVLSPKPPRAQQGRGLPKPLDAAPIMPGEATAAESLDSRSKLGASFIGSRLYRLGLNPIKKIGLGKQEKFRADANSRVVMLENHRRHPSKRNIGESPGSNWHSWDSLALASGASLS